VNWHPKCFVCTFCKKDFPKGEFVEYEEMPYCPSCVPKSSELCSGCSKQLSGKVCNIASLYWHEGCFKCTSCKKAFGKSYSVYNGYPYCEPCHIQLSADRCVACNQPMVGEAVKIAGKEWHRACVKCNTCSKALGNVKEGEIYVKFSKVYCKACHGGANTSVVTSGVKTTNVPSSSAKFCGNCGAPGSGGNFCNSCGSKM
jgi:hypothetical protein